MTDDEWQILEPLVRKCERSAERLRRMDMLANPTDDRAKMEHWIAIRKLQKIHDGDIAEMESALERLNLI